MSLHSSRDFSVNGEYEGDDPIGRLMHDFRCTRAEDMYYPVLAERVKYLMIARGDRKEKEIAEDVGMTLEEVKNCQR